MCTMLSFFTTQKIQTFLNELLIANWPLGSWL
jgi:hypothetical protein